MAGCDWADAAASGPATASLLAAERTSAFGAWRRLFDRSIDSPKRAFERRAGLVDDDLSQRGSLDTGQPVLLRAFERHHIKPLGLRPRRVGDAHRDVQGGMK